MAGRGLGTLTLDLVARTGGFTGPLDKAQRDLDKRMTAMSKRAEKFGKVIGASLIAAASAAGYAIKGAIDRADELSKGAQKIGVTTEALSRLAYAADLSDVSIEQLQGGLAKMTKYQAEAAQGGKEATKTFEAFGIAIKDSAGNLRGTEAVLQDFARVFAALPDGPEKTALALRVFGRAGAELIPLLNSGAKGLADMAAEADRLGITISGEVGKQAEQFNDSLTTLQQTMVGVANKVLQPLLPELIKLSGALQGLAEDGANSFSFADQMGRDLAEVSKTIRLVSVEIGYLKRLWNEQGLFGDGVFSALSKAQDDFAAGEAARALQGTRYAGGPAGGRGAGAGRRAGAEDAAAREAEGAAKKLLATTQDNTSASKANAEAKRKAAEAAREQEKRERDLAEAVEKATQAQADFTRQMEDLIAQQGGPLAESQLRYRREEDALRKLWAEGSTPNAEELTRALEALHDARDKDAEAIRKSLDTGGMRLEQLQNELNLIQMTSQAERDRAAFLLDNPTATGDQADAAARLMGQIDETQKAISVMDDFRASTEDAFASFLDGSKSAKEAFDDLAKSVLAQIARMIAQQWVEKLFGQTGTSGGGILGSLAGALFGGGGGGVPAGGNNFGIPGFASGTNFAPGGMAIVGERGPEIVNLPRGSQVIPNARTGGVTVNVGVNGEVSMKTQVGIGRTVARKLEHAQRGRLR